MLSTIYFLMYLFLLLHVGNVLCIFNYKNNINTDDHKEPSFRKHKTASTLTITAGIVMNNLLHDKERKERKILRKSLLEVFLCSRTSCLFFFFLVSGFPFVIKM